jgi:hypothetical protein
LRALRAFRKRWEELHVDRPSLTADLEAR